MSKSEIPSGDERYYTELRNFINSFANEVHANSVAKGFYENFVTSWVSNDGERKIEQIATRLALIHSEVSEALECIRAKDFTPERMLYVVVPSEGMYGKPEGLASELADIIIRVLDLASALKIDIGESLVAKARYTRPDHISTEGRQSRRLPGTLNPG